MPNISAGSTAMNNHGQMWAITTFFNPMRYKRRLENYRLFRRGLQLPLIAVELAYCDDFELGPDDAEILLQLRGEAVLWQKERLLNIALRMLPKDIQFVAWLDCDIVFERECWAEKAVRQLEHTPLIQLFACVYDLERGVAPSDAHLRPGHPTGFSIAYLMRRESADTEDFRPSTNERVRRAAFGLGWAARRALLDEYGLYDAMILGGGDHAIACAAYGRFDDAIHIGQFSECWAAHYLTWSRPFFEQVQGNVGYVDGAIFHLWHGEFTNRKYIDRHVDFAGFGFDPSKDIHIDPQGCWAWSNENSSLREFVHMYFASRNEDGEAALSTPAQEK
jgi:hypothetical protein